jgi:hypothetical protein
MRATLPLKAANARADRAEERARENALRTQIDELNAEMVVMRAEADRALDRLYKQVDEVAPVSWTPDDLCWRSPRC